MHQELLQMIDISCGDELVEVEVSETVGRPGFLTLWVNIDGVCRLRVAAISPDLFRAKIKRNLHVRRTRG